MGSVILALTLSMALFKGAMVGALRKLLPYIQPISAAVMILAGSYIVFYWLTLGRDLL
jgi:cytochrome c-type biogenesis protein